MLLPSPVTIVGLSDHMSSAEALLRHTPSRGWEDKGQRHQMSLPGFADRGHAGTLPPSTDHGSRTSHHGEESHLGRPLEVLILSLSRRGPLLGKYVLPIPADSGRVHRRSRSRSRRSVRPPGAAGRERSCPPQRNQPGSSGGGAALTLGGGGQVMPWGGSGSSRLSVDVKGSPRAGAAFRLADLPVRFSRTRTSAILQDRLPKVRTHERTQGLLRGRWRQ